VGLARLGVTAQAFSHHFGTWRARGGTPAADDDWGHSASYDLFALADLEELAGLRGASALLHVKGQYDRGPNGEVGALSDPIDDADFDEAVYVDELWVQQGLLGGGLRLRVGFLEQQTVFDRNAFANSEDRQFLASFLDNDGLVPLPNGLGAVLLLEPVDWLELAAGVADADNVSRRSGFDTAFDDADGWTAHFEGALKGRLPGRGGGLPGTLRLGVFRDGRERAVFGTGRSTRGHWGFYASLDQVVLRGRGDGAPRVGVFARLGAADPDTSRAAWLWAAGLEVAGPLPGRGGDVLGLGAYQAIASRRYRDEVDPGADRETGLELYYAIALRPWLVLTPDLQVILDPGAAGAGRNAVLATLRARITY
jgi:porin